jgi:hypothetical protein
LYIVQLFIVLSAYLAGITAAARFLRSFGAVKRGSLPATPQKSTSGGSRASDSTGFAIIKLTFVCNASKLQQAAILVALEGAR